MAIEELTHVVPPPEHPVETARPGQWEAVQQALGMRLPADLRDFGITYGTGYFDDPGRLRIYVWNPFGTHYRRQVASAYRHLMTIYELGHRPLDYPEGELPPDPVYLPWGSDIDGNFLCWLRQGEADAWPIVLLAPARRGFQQLQRPLGDFLAGAFTRRLLLMLWYPPAFFRGQPPVHFVPTPARTAEQGHSD
jgi:hypothetical protein